MVGLICDLRLLNPLRSYFSRATKSDESNSLSGIFVFYRVGLQT
jgi:hypothetical protein